MSVLDFMSMDDLNAYRGDEPDDERFVKGTKTTFEWCPRCAYFKDCYAGGPHPKFLEPACGEGPA